MKISAMTEATTIEDDDQFVIVQDSSGENRRVKMSNLTNYFPQFVKVSLTAAQVKALNSVPVLAVAAPGNGFAIEVVSASASLTYGSVAFLNAGLQIKTDTATTIQASTHSAFLPATNSIFQRIISATTSANLIQLVDNKGLYITAAADSANGDSTVDIYILYRIITL